MSTTYTTSRKIRWRSLNVKVYLFFLQNINKIIKNLIIQNKKKISSMDWVIKICSFCLNFNILSTSIFSMSLVTLWFCEFESPTWIKSFFTILIESLVSKNWFLWFKFNVSRPLNLFSYFLTLAFITVSIISFNLSIGSISLKFGVEFSKLFFKTWIFLLKTFSGLVICSDLSFWFVFWHDVLVSIIWVFWVIKDILISFESWLTFYF